MACVSLDISTWSMLETFSKCMDFPSPLSQVMSSMDLVFGDVQPLFNC